MKKVIWLLTVLTFFATVLLFAKPVLRTKIKLSKSIDSLIVFKQKGILIVYNNGIEQKKYRCGVGDNLIGHKQKKGDNRTPEGKYYITDRSNKSDYYKNLHISYPNETDIANAAKNKVNPGGDIKIHGYANKFGNFIDRYLYYSSTRGCVGVTNNDMDELFKWVKDSAVITILP
jgi:murein L,D-transpeptidase YafK